MVRSLSGAARGSARGQADRRRSSSRRRPAQHVLLFGRIQEGRHGPVGQHHVAVSVDDQHGVAQRRDEGVGLGLLLRQREQAGLVLPAQPLGLGAGLLVPHQRLDHAQQVVGQERLGQEEVDPLAGGRDGQCRCSA